MDIFYHFNFCRNRRNGFWPWYYYYCMQINRGVFIFLSFNTAETDAVGYLHFPTYIA